MIASWFAIALPALFAADAGADFTAPPPVSAPPLIAPVGPPRAAQTERIDLKDAKDGSGDLLYQGNGFSARIAPDGSVTFSDKNLSGLNPIAWAPMKTRMPVPSLQSSLTRFLQGRKPPAPPPSELDEGLPPPETTQVNPEVSRYRPDPREGCRECTFNSLAVPVQGVARFDVADQLERFSGKDPHRYQKAVFLAATHEQRVQMAVRTHARNIRRESVALPGRLQAIACDDRLTHEERRSIIAALAAEMDAGTPEGASSRKTINAFLGRLDGGEVSCAKPAP